MQFISVNINETLKSVILLYSMYVCLALSFQESGKNEKKSYMRYYVPYKPGDEFKYRTPEGKQNNYSFALLKTDL